MPKIEIDIYPWPSRESEDSEYLQADIYVDGQEVCDYTAPGDTKRVFYQGVDLLSENWAEWVANAR